MAGLGKKEDLEEKPSPPDNSEILFILTDPKVPKFQYLSNKPELQDFFRNQLVLLIQNLKYRPSFAAQLMEKEVIHQAPKEDIESKQGNQEKVDCLLNYIKTIAHLLGLIYAIKDDKQDKSILINMGLGELVGENPTVSRSPRSELSHEPTISSMALPSSAQTFPDGVRSKACAAEQNEKASPSNTISIHPWSASLEEKWEALEEEWEVDLATSLEHIVINEPPLVNDKNGYRLRVKTLSGKMDELCQQLGISVNMVIDVLDSRDKDWSQEGLALQYILQNWELMKCGRLILITIEKITKVDHRGDKHNIEETHQHGEVCQVQTIVKGLRRYFVVHFPKSTRCTPQLEYHISNAKVENLSFHVSKEFEKEKVLCKNTSDGLDPKQLEWVSGVENHIITFIQGLQSTHTQLLRVDLVAPDHPEQNRISGSNLTRIIEDFIINHQLLTEFDDFMMKTPLLNHSPPEFKSGLKLIQSTKNDFTKVANKSYVKRTVEEVEECIRKWKGIHRADDFHKVQRYLIDKINNDNILEVCFCGVNKLSQKERELPNERINVVIFGNAGSGRSSTCNTLFGENIFPTDSGTTLVTSDVQSHDIELDRMKLRLIDTPPVSDILPSSAEKATNTERMAKNFNKIIELADNRIHAFLHVQSADKRFTQEERNMVAMIEEQMKDTIYENLAFIMTKGMVRLSDRNFGSIRKYLEQGISEPNIKYYLESVEKSKYRLLLLENCYESHLLKKSQQKNLLLLIKIVLADTKCKPYEYVGERAAPSFHKLCTIL